MLSARPCPSPSTSYSSLGLRFRIRVLKFLGANPHDAYSILEITTSRWRATTPPPWPLMVAMLAGAQRRAVLEPLLQTLTTLEAEGRVISATQQGSPYFAIAPGR